MVGNGAGVEGRLKRSTLYGVLFPPRGGREIETLYSVWSSVSAKGRSGDIVKVPDYRENKERFPLLHIVTSGLVLVDIT